MRKNSDKKSALSLFFYILISFVFLTLLGCSSKVDFIDVIGVYKLRYPYGNEELLLAKDGSYMQSVLIDGETSVKTNKGRWEFKEKEPDIVLFDAMIVDDYFGHVRPDYWKIEPGLSFFPARKSFGKVSLAVNPDLGFAFKKIRGE